MVKPLSSEDHAFLNDAIKQAERKTSAKISVVVRPASDSYQAYILVYALALGSVSSVMLWHFHVVRDFPWLLSIQLGVVALCDLIHSLNLLFVGLVPRRIRHHQAAHTAMRDYHELHARQAKDAPFVLLFVSLAERYVHVVTSPTVHQRVPDDWHKVTETFTQSAPRQGVRAACIEAIGRITDILAARFPA